MLNRRSFVALAGASIAAAVVPAGAAVKAVAKAAVHKEAVKKGPMYNTTFRGVMVTSRLCLDTISLDPTRLNHIKVGQFKKAGCINDGYDCCRIVEYMVVICLKDDDTGLELDPREFGGHEVFKCTACGQIWLRWITIHPASHKPSACWADPCDWEWLREACRYSVCPASCHRSGMR